MRGYKQILLIASVNLTKEGCTCELNPRTILKADVNFSRTLAMRSQKKGAYFKTQLYMCTKLDKF